MLCKRQPLNGHCWKQKRVRVHEVSSGVHDTAERRQPTADIHMETDVTRIFCEK